MGNDLIKYFGLGQHLCAFILLDIWVTWCQSQKGDAAFSARLIFTRMRCEVAFVDTRVVVAGASQIRNA